MFLRRKEHVVEGLIRVLACWRPFDAADAVDVLSLALVFDWCHHRRLLFSGDDRSRSRSRSRFQRVVGMPLVVDAVEATGP